MESGQRAPFLPLGSRESGSPVALSAIKHGAGALLFMGMPAPRGAGAETRRLRGSEGYEEESNDENGTIQMQLLLTTTSPEARGGSAARQAQATALQGQ